MLVLDLGELSIVTEKPQITPAETDGATAVIASNFSYIISVLWRALSFCSKTTFCTRVRVMPCLGFPLDLKSPDFRRLKIQALKSPEIGHWS